MTPTLRRMLASSKVRLWLVPEKAAWAKPALLIALGLPLIFRLVPKNWLYGMRTPYTLRGSDETWYRQNLISGVALVLVGAVWLAKLAILG